MKKCLVATMLLVGLVLASPAMAGPLDWWAWTNDSGDNDYMNPNNHAWGKSPWANPADIDTVLSQRHELGRASAAALGAPIAQVANLDGLSATYLAYLAAHPEKTGVTQTYGGMEIDSGMTFNIYNGASYTVNSGVSANGLGSDIVSDRTDGLLNWEGNHLRTSVHVYAGGQFAATSFTGNITAVGYTADAGVFAEGKATVNITGNYVIGGNTSQGNGGGHLTVKGYDADTVLSIADGAGQKIFMGSAFYNNSAPSAGRYGSDPAELKVILDASNDGGLFNTVQTNMLDLRSRYIDPIIGETDTFRPVKFTVELDGYTATPGQVFAIIIADSITSDGGTTLNELGIMDKGWDTTFTVDGVAFQFHQTYNGQSGVFLEVAQDVIPEPATISLLVIGGVAALIRRRRK